MTFPVSAAPLNAEWAIPLPPTLLERWLNRVHLTWPRAIVAAGAILLASLAGAVRADGMTLAEFIESGAWRVLFMPSIAMYCLIVYPMHMRARSAEAKAYRALVDLSDADYLRVLAMDPLLAPWRQWLALGLGFAFGVSGRLFSQSEGWLELYRALTNGLMWALVALSAAMSVGISPLLERLKPHGLRVNLFDPSFIQPAARLSLLPALAFAGGITISLLFIPIQDLLNPGNLIIYAVLVIVIVWVFYQAMKGTHRVMADAKLGELTFVRQMLAEVYGQLRLHPGQTAPNGLQPAVEEVRSWLVLEQRLQAVPEWPVDLRTVRNLLLSILVPIISVLARLVMENLF